MAVELDTIQHYYVFINQNNEIVFVGEELPFNNSCSYFYYFQFKLKM